MKEPVLIIIKPDALQKGLAGHVLNSFYRTGLSLVALRVAPVTRELAKQHYIHIRDTPFYESVLDFFTGKLHKIENLILMIFYGEDAIRLCRDIAGKTNPEEADPSTVRGAFGRITTDGVYENVVHVSDDPDATRREIQLWFRPDDVCAKIYPTEEKSVNGFKERVWI